ncbi:MAG: hypothetical protein ACRD1A_02485 [Terriglobales bacterium]
MQAYKALQSNSEAIACDIASFLMRTPTAPLQPNGPNAVVGGRYRPLASACSSALAAAPTGVVVLDASGGTLQSLQLWRTDMAMMDWMQTAADSVCTAPAAPAGAPALTGEAPGGTMGLIGTGVTTGLGEVGTAIQLLKLIAPSETATGLTGTIGDRALMDGVSRQLRVLGVPIFMPDAMAPLLFAYPSARHPSPLFSAMAKLSATQSCLQTKSAAGNADAKTTLAAVQGFLTSLSTAAVGQPSPLQAAMAGDELEQAIGAGASDPKPPAWHLLLLQALESGGSEITHGGLFGSGVEYSGGSVATYELFDLRGSLTCSGNVFDYGGERSPDDLSRDFLRPNLAPGRQLIFLRGGCAPEPAH